MVHQTFADFGPALSTNYYDFLKVTPTFDPVSDKLFDITIKKSAPRSDWGSLARFLARPSLTSNSLKPGHPNSTSPRIWSGQGIQLPSRGRPTPFATPSWRRPPTTWNADSPTGHVTERKGESDLAYFGSFLGCSEASPHFGANVAGKIQAVGLFSNPSRPTWQLGIRH